MGYSGVLSGVSVLGAESAGVRSEGNFGKLVYTTIVLYIGYVCHQFLNYSTMTVECISSYKHDVVVTPSFLSLAIRQSPFT